MLLRTNNDTKRPLLTTNISAIVFQYFWLDLHNASDFLFLLHTHTAHLWCLLVMLELADGGCGSSEAAFSWITGDFTGSESRDRQDKNMIKKGKQTAATWCESNSKLIHTCPQDVHQYVPWCVSLIKQLWGQGRLMCISEHSGSPFNRQWRCLGYTLERKVYVFN